jgi:hypothetical protein
MNMYLPSRITTIVYWMFDSHMADFVMVQTLRYICWKRTGKCDRESVEKFMAGIPNIMRNMMTKTGARLKDEYFL